LVGASENQKERADTPGFREVNARSDARLSELTRGQHFDNRRVVLALLRGSIVAVASPYPAVVEASTRPAPAHTRVGFAAASGIFRERRRAFARRKIRNARATRTRTRVTFAVARSTLNADSFAADDQLNSIRN